MGVGATALPRRVEVPKELPRGGTSATNGSASLFSSDSVLSSCACQGECASTGLGICARRQHRNAMEPVGMKETARFRTSATRGSASKEPQTPHGKEGCRQASVRGRAERARESSSGWSCQVGCDFVFCDYRLLSEHVPSDHVIDLFFVEIVRHTP